MTVDPKKKLSLEGSMGLQALVALGRPPAYGRVGLPYGQQCRTRMEYGW